MVGTSYRSDIEDIIGCLDLNRVLKAYMAYFEDQLK